MATVQCAAKDPGSQPSAIENPEPSPRKRSKTTMNVSSRKCRAPGLLLLPLLLLRRWGPVQASAAPQENPYDDAAAVRTRVAIIGGAITGSLTSKYLVDYDVHCRLHSLTVFEAVPLRDPVDVQSGVDPWPMPYGDGSSPESFEQGTRVQTVRLSDGTTLVEVGASIGFRDFHLLLDLVRGDPEHLKLAPPFDVGPEARGRSQDDDPPLRQGIGVYRGMGEGGKEQGRDPWSINTAATGGGGGWFSLPLLPAALRSTWKKVGVLWRYGWELRRISKLTQHVLKQFARLPLLLAEVDDPGTYFESPLDVWRAVKLDSLVNVSFDAVLDALGVPAELPTWRQWLGQGSVRNELLVAINLVNYNQDNSRANGVVGIGSYAASTGGLFSIEGGNVRLIASALMQANRARERFCHNNTSTSDDPRGNPRVLEMAKRVTTVVATAATSDNASSFELFADGESLGIYDVVVLAAPFPQARIDFFVQSTMDPSVLQPMPLGRGSVVDPERHAAAAMDPASIEGYAPFPRGLDPATTRPYTPVVTTVVSHANLTLLPSDQLPRSVLMNAEGKRSLYNITAITQIHSRGVYKVFSDAPLPRDALEHLFGPRHVVECVKAWAGPYGGATPDYRGSTSLEHFVLYDGASGLEGATDGIGGGALYYPNAMEQSGLACMELAAVGAKTVAKLIARRLGLIRPQTLEYNSVREEL